jgi:hypothetical protein
MNETQALNFLLYSDSLSLNLRLTLILQHEMRGGCGVVYNKVKGKGKGTLTS